MGTVPVPKITERMVSAPRKVLSGLRHTDAQSARRIINLFALEAIGIAPSLGNPFIMPRTKKLFPLHTHGLEIR